MRDQRRAEVVRPGADREDRTPVVHPREEQVDRLDPILIVGSQLKASVALAPAAHALFPQDETCAAEWYQHMQTPLFRGDIRKITHPLQQAGLADYARYFEHHQRRMQYQETREEGWLIGSGPVQSAIKNYKTRLTGPGMRWSRPNGDRMLVLRSAVLSSEFDALWAAA
jgi:hypothetical protein